MTSGERVMKNVVEGINRAFQGVTVTNPIGTTEILVRALERHGVPGQGMTMGGQNGFTLTIGDRVAQFSGEGRLIEQGKAPVERTETEWKRVKDGKPMQYAKFCRSEITEAELFAEEAKVIECKVCHVALYDEAAKIGYCTNHESKAAVKK